MSPRHHLEPATLIGHATGALSPEVAAIVDTHLLGCADCRQALSLAEKVGGVLMGQQRQDAVQEPRRDALRAQMLARLDAADVAVAGATPMLPQASSLPIDPDCLPAPLQPYFGRRYSELKWRWMGPGRHFIRSTGPSGATLLMLRIGPGRSVPVHGHAGCEITQILRGAYDDALGHFAAGDVADLDSDTEHQPVTSAGEPCICVAVLDAPLRFPGWFARRLQPLIGF